MKNQIELLREEIESVIETITDIESKYDREIEKLNTAYVVDQFKDCKTCGEFKAKLTEITNRSYNFM